MFKSINPSYDYEVLLNEFCMINNLPFSNKQLLQTAFTHSSYANEHQIAENNERLEFLGDGVLEIVVRDYLYNNQNHYTEGNMTKIKENFVDSDANYQHAKRLNLGKYLLLGNGMNAENTSILGDAFEALIGAIYLDLGFSFAYDYLYNQILPNVDIDKQSYKNLLQEKAIPNVPEYRLISETGPDHNKTFTVEVFIDGKSLGTGSAKKRKDAEKLAAKVALDILENKHDYDLKRSLSYNNDEPKHPQDNQPTANGKLILQNFIKQMKHSQISHQNNQINYKGRLQETYPFPPYVIKYTITSESGPDHSKSFDVDVSINGEIVGSGFGRKKKDAEQDAARDALENLKSQS